VKGWDFIAGLTPPRCCVCVKPHVYRVSGINIKILQSHVGGIIDHHCLNFLFIKQ